MIIIELAARERARPDVKSMQAEYKAESLYIYIYIRFYTTKLTHYSCAIYDHNDYIL